jgi:hypothetical protein
LYGAHNSGIVGGHGHAVGATIATVANARWMDYRADDSPVADAITGFIADG